MHGCTYGERDDLIEEHHRRHVEVEHKVLKKKILY